MHRSNTLPILKLKQVRLLVSVLCCVVQYVTIVVGVIIWCLECCTTSERTTKPHQAKKNANNAQPEKEQQPSYRKYISETERERETERENLLPYIQYITNSGAIGILRYLKPSSIKSIALTMCHKTT